MCKATDPLQGYFPNENENNMNEYKGFKVGDKVEITKKPATWASIIGQGAKFPLKEKFPFTGVIEMLQMDGSNCYALISGFGFGFSTAIMERNVKKLPKYSVGDVVRAKDGFLYEIKEYNGFEEMYYFGNGNPRFPEKSLEPFDGFRPHGIPYTEAIERLK